MIDLHIHTVASSDGQHTALEIFQMAAELGIWALAFADHNSTGSVDEGIRLARESGIKFIPCVELDTVYKDRDLHLLGYFIDHESPECREWMESVFNAKIEQTKKRVEKLKSLGFSIEFEELMRLSKGSMPTGNTYVQVLAQRPENKGDPRISAFIDGDRSDSPYLNFYLDYLKAGRPAFVPLEAQKTVEAVERVKKLGGVSVLAHPSDTPETYIHELADAGMQGLEVYSSYHDKQQTEMFMGLCRDRSLLITAGSDFHGKKIKPRVKMGVQLDDEEHIIEALYSATQKG